MFALFNKNKQFIGYSPDIPDNTPILKKKINEEFSDPLKWKWVGDYDTGKMVSVDKSDDEIKDDDFLFEVSNKYNLNEKFNIIIRQLEKILEKNQDLKTEEFTQMSSDLSKAFDIWKKKYKL